MRLFEYGWRRTYTVHIVRAFATSKMNRRFPWFSLRRHITVDGKEDMYY